MHTEIRCEVASAGVCWQMADRETSVAFCVPVDSRKPTEEGKTIQRVKWGEGGRNVAGVGGTGW